jgi:hypothetical protein
LFCLDIHPYLEKVKTPIFRRREYYVYVEYSYYSLLVDELHITIRCALVELRVMVFFVAEV